MKSCSPVSECQGLLLLLGPWLRAGACVACLLLAECCADCLVFAPQCLQQVSQGLILGAAATAAAAGPRNAWAGWLLQAP